jgi:hypothetical protein
MTRALAARTWSELRDLLADHPATRLAPQARPPGPPVPSPGRFAPPLIVVLAGIGITTAMLVNVTHGRWGFIWLLLPVLPIARHLSCYPCTPRRCGQKY